MENNNNLKLIYINKIGYNSKGEGLFEFIFSKDETNIDIEGWLWDISPACDNATPPTEEYYDKIYNLKTRSFDLFCLHESVDREYMHGYYTIHALAYETERSADIDGINSYEKLFGDENVDEAPLLVFHYGMTFEKVKHLLNERKFILKNNDFIETSSIKFE